MGYRECQFFGNIWLSELSKTIKGLPIHITASRSPIHGKKDRTAVCAIVTAAQTTKPGKDFDATVNCLSCAARVFCHIVNKTPKS